MIEVYDEVNYIKEVLEHGFGPHWQRDATLLIKYYKSSNPPYKKSTVKQIIKEKCKMYVPGYNEISFFRTINTMVDDVWKKWKVDKEHPENSSKLREIRSIEFSREVLDWFLNLDQFKISEERAKELSENRQMKIKINPMNMDRIKYLFTLFVWTKIQENYLDKPNVFYLKNQYKKFKRDANLRPVFSMTKDRNLLYDLGFININHGLGITPIFMENEVFSIPVTDDNRVSIEGKDLYDCGWWLDKKKYGYFVCENCGKEVLNHKTSSKKSNRGRPKKYCKECSDKLNHIRGAQIKTIICVDCGREFEVSIDNTRATRCRICQCLKYKKKDRERKQAKKAKIPSYDVENSKPAIPSLTRL